jgi:capsular polysaccharide biosynthesis protein
MQVFATSEKKREGGEIANQLDNKTKEGTNDIMNVFERKMK